MPRLRNSTSLAVVVDSMAALGLAVGAVVWSNHGNIAATGLARFLWIRITLLNASFAIVFVIVWKQCLTYCGLYHRDLSGMRRLAMRTAAACTIMTLLLAWYLEARHARGPIGQILAIFFAGAFLLEAGRVVLSSRHVGWPTGEQESVLIIGSGRRAAKAWRELRLQHPRSKRLLGFVDDRPAAAMPPDIASRLVGNIDQLPGFLLRNVVDEIVVAAPIRTCYDLGQRAVSIAETAGVRVLCLNDVFTLTREKPVRRRSSLFVELAPKDPRRQAAEAGKRIFDAVAAGAGIVLLSPVFLIIAVAIKLTSSGSILEVQEQLGYGRRCFRMFKFRTSDSTRRSTWLGRFLDRTLLDGLPELWSVLLGDMSFVGPRPILSGDLSLLGQAQAMRRFSVRPGMTGNWQGLLELSVEQGVALDFSYIDQWSFTSDLKLLARTVPGVLRRVGSDW